MLLFPFALPVIDTRLDKTLPVLANLGQLLSDYAIDLLHEVLGA